MPTLLPGKSITLRSENGFKVLLHGSMVQPLKQFLGELLKKLTFFHVLCLFCGTGDGTQTSHTVSKCSITELSPQPSLLPKNKEFPKLFKDTA